MIALGTLRAHPHCACLFDDVPVLFWPILWWQLNNMICWMRGANVSGVRFEPKAWGFITLRYVVYQPGPNAYRPVERTFRALSDPSWGTSLPPILFQKWAKGASLFFCPAHGEASLQVRWPLSPWPPTRPCIAVLM